MQKTRKNEMRKIYQKQFPNNGERKVFVFQNEYICPHCNRGLIELSNQEKEKRKSKYEWTDLVFGEFEDVDFMPGLIQLADYTCPHCGYTFVIKPGYLNKNEVQSNYDIYEIEWSQVCRKTSESIHYKPKEQTFHVFISFLNYIPTKNGVITKTEYIKWIIDLKNHRMFYYDPQTKKIVNGTNHFGQSFVWYKSLMNNATKTLWSKLLKYMCYVKGVPYIYKELTKKITLFIKEINVSVNDSLFSQYAFFVTNALNRIPNTIIEYDEYKNTYKCILDPTLFWKKDYYTNEFINASPHEITDYQTYIKNMIEIYDLPKSKSFWKLYLKDSNALNKALYFKSCGFKNNDNLLKLVKNDSSIANIVSSGDGNKQNNTNLKTFATIVRKMLKVSPESTVANKINSIGGTWGNKWEIQDLIRMYDKIKVSKKEYLKMMNWSGSFREIHDELSKLLSKIAYENVDIPYTEKDGQLQAEFFGYSFDLAKDTNQLVEIGQKMGICVGGYREQVLRKISKIIHVRYDDKYVGCIELGQGNSLKQAKAKYNNMMTGDLAKALKMWVKKRNIKDAEQCHDYRNLDIETHKTYDYHSLELDKDGNVVRPEVRNYTANERELEMLDEDWIPF